MNYVYYKQFSYNGHEIFGLVTAWGTRDHRVNWLGLISQIEKNMLTVEAWVFHVFDGNYKIMNRLSFYLILTNYKKNFFTVCLIYNIFPQNCRIVMTSGY